VINEVEFHQKMRGYDPDEVDDFLERVAVAVGQLQDRTREAAERAAIAERRAAELEAHLRSGSAKPAAPRPSEAVPADQPAQAPAPAAAAPSASAEEDAETIRRTLILAQRTADAAVQEAQEAAAATLQSAQEEAQRVLTEAQERAQALVANAEAEARKTADGTRQRLVAEIIALEESRDGLRADHGILERHLEEQRLRLRSSIGDLQRLLDDPGRLRLASAPTLRGATRPPFLDEELREAAGSEPGADDAAGEDQPAVIDLDASSPAVEEPATDDDAAVASDMAAFEADAAPAEPALESRPTTGGVTFTAPDERGPTPAAPSARLAVKDREADAWARFAEAERVGPPTQAIDLGAADDDLYLAELRKAMLDDTSPSGAGVEEEDEREASRPRARFGRRR
jgi:DivIVA domain-containing protein